MLPITMPPAIPDDRPTALVERVVVAVPVRRTPPAGGRADVWRAAASHGRDPRRAQALGTGTIVDTFA